MAQFQRPANAIKDVATLKDGDTIFHVYGIWPPSGGGAGIVRGKPIPFRQHSAYEDIHERQAELIVFDVEVEWSFKSGTYLQKNFASDGNLTPGHSHNDNYWFRSQEDADAARDYLRSEWEKRPDLIAMELERRERDRLFDEMWFDDIGEMVDHQSAGESLEAVSSEAASGPHE